MRPEWAKDLKEGDWARTKKLNFWVRFSDMDGMLTVTPDEADEGLCLDFFTSEMPIQAFFEWDELEPEDINMRPNQ